MHYAYPAACVYGICGTRQDDVAIPTKNPSPFTDPSGTRGSTQSFVNTSN